MKRLIGLAALSLAIWVGATASVRASAFGLSYNRDCGGCGACGGICIRPYNAFSSAACGIATFTCGGGGGGCCSTGRCGGGSCHNPFFGPKRVCNHHGDCSRRCFAPFHHHTVGPNGEGWCDDGSDGAFVGGTPFAYGDWNGPLSCGKGPCGYEPPPGPPVVYSPPPQNPIVWLPAKPFPGMYGFANPMVQYPANCSGMCYPQAGYGYGYPQQQLMQQPAYGQGQQVAPVSYQQAYPQQNYGQPAMWWYPAQQSQGWYNPASGQ